MVSGATSKTYCLGHCNGAWAGIQIQVYGALAPANVSTPYQVSATFTVGEGTSPSSYTNRGPPKKSLFHLLTYTSPILPSGEHTLVVTNNADYLWIDYFVYTEPGYTAGSSRTKKSNSTSTLSHLASSTSTTSLSSQKLSSGRSPGGSLQMPSSFTRDAHSITSISNASSYISLSGSSLHPAFTSNITTPVASAKQTYASYTASHAISKGAVGGIAAGGFILLLVLTGTLAFCRTQHLRRAWSILHYCEPS